ARRRVLSLEVVVGHVLHRTSLPHAGTTPQGSTPAGPSIQAVGTDGVLAPHGVHLPRRHASDPPMPAWGYADRYPGRADPRLHRHGLGARGGSACDSAFS